MPALRIRPSGAARRAVATLLVGCLTATLADQQAASGRPAPGNGFFLAAQSDTAVAGTVAKPRAAVSDPAVADAAARTGKLPAPSWPAPSTVDVALPSTGPATTPVGRHTPVALAPVVPSAKTAGSAPTRIRIQTYDHPAAVAAGVNGLIMRVGRIDSATTSGPARVSVDYSGFATAYGADWAARLRLVQLPSCTLTSAAGAGCGRVTPLDSSNDATAHTVTATVSAAMQSGTTGGTLLALDAGPQSGDGDYSATPLNPSAAWSADGDSGDFTWTYPIRTPPATGGLTPTITLGYSAQSVDGMMAASNNQPSWLGEGFDFSPGSIERGYRGCADDMDGPGHDNTQKTGDLCWETDNATLAMSGHAGELIKDPTDPNRWHLRDDDGTLVTHETGAANGDNDGEWWIVTTTDGTQYWFGGVASAASTWNVPVFGNDPGEPCHGATFAASSCSQAYRWNLDYVVDAHGNTITYQYAKETNKYARNLSSSDPASYDRGGYLTEIDYGTHTAVSGSAPVQVSFAPADRCLSSCSTHDKAHWPDTPWDEQCTAAPCTTYGPTFWSTQRLGSITTRVWNGSGYSDVERWTFTHTFPDPGDGTRAGMWLSSISHVGLDGGTTTAEPDTRFDGVQLANRVDTLNDSLYPMKWWRIAHVFTDSGGEISVTYAPQDCIPGSRMPDPAHLENNALRCYPVIWQPPSATAPITDLFNKYVVSEVKEDDLTGGSPTVYHDYDYVGDPAWHYTDDDGIVTAKAKTWSVWRGYATVRVRGGDPTKMTQTLAQTDYFRGMNGDHLPSGTRSVNLPAVPMGGTPDVPAAADDDAFAGQVRQSVTYNGVGGAEVSATVNEPWESAPTASRTINGSTVTARLTGVAAVHTRVPLDTDGGTRAASTRTTSKYTTFDDLGVPVAVDDHGDDAVVGDEKCSLTTYARNTAKWMMSYQARTQSFATDCAHAQAGGLTDADVISDALTRYDNQAAGAAPTTGDVTEIDGMSAYNGGSPTYIATARTAYDAYGRPTDTWDVSGNHSTTAYTPASGGPLTQTVATNPKGWTTTTTLDPGYGLSLSAVDVNGYRTDRAYDGLGRLTSVWLPGQAKPGDASVTYAYLVRTDGANAVTTDTLDAKNGYITTTALLDGLLRPRQTQKPGAGLGGGRTVTDTAYDSAGRAVKTTTAYLAPGSVSADLYTPTVPENLPGWTTTTFDGANRAVLHSFFTKNTLRWSTATAYTGDRTDVIPPAGSPPTSSVVDAAGNTTALRRYHGATTTGPYDATTYRYDRKGQLTRITDPDGAQWSYTYDVRGRKVSSTDPDAGTMQTTYDDADRVVTTTDARNEVLAYTYDTLGRKTNLRDGSVTGPLRAQWVYDLVAKGQLASSTRYDASGAYTNAFTGYNQRYEPTGQQITIPSSQSGTFGATTFSYVYTYFADGTPASTRIAAAGDLPIETLNYQYSDLNLPSTMNTNLGGTLVTATGYTDYAEPNILTLQNNSGKIAQIGDYYEEGTHRLAEIKTTSAATPTTTYADVNYSYDPAGNITKIADAAAGDTQCFGYDDLSQLSAAWTPASGDCSAAPTVTALGGPAPYWQSWTVDAAGNRQSEVDHGATDTTYAYTYPAAGAAQPHAPTKVVAGGAVNRTDSFAYDASGDTTSRPAANGAPGQTLAWDAEGKLSSVTDSTGATSYIYDADGNRLLQVDPTGKTLYLPGQEIRHTTATNSTACTRYYSEDGKTIAMRTGTGLTWLSTDDQDTATVAIAAATQAVSVRRTTPYGSVRGSLGSWPAAMDKGFVGGTVEGDGLTDLGARAYDPGLGRFVSVDPVIDIHSPQQMNGYAYAGNSPVTSSDPSGAYVNLTGCPDGDCSQAPVYLGSASMETDFSPTWGGKTHPNRQVRHYKFYAMPDGTLAKVQLCPGQSALECMPQRTTLGPLASCSDVGNAELPCYRDPDGKVRFANGSPACGSHVSGPCAYSHPSVLPSSDGSVQQRTCAPPPPVMTNPAPPVITNPGTSSGSYSFTEGDGDACNTFWGCVAVHLDLAANVLGEAGLICEPCDALSAGLAGASAVAYLLDGQTDKGIIEAGVGAVSLFGGRYFANVAETKLADKGFGEGVRQFGGMAAGTIGGYESGYVFGCIATQGKEGCYEMAFMEKPKESSD